MICIYFFRYLSFVLDARGLGEVSLVSEHATLKPATCVINSTVLAGQKKIDIIPTSSVNSIMIVYLGKKTQSYFESSRFDLAY